MKTQTDNETTQDCRSAAEIARQSDFNSASVASDSPNQSNETREGKWLPITEDRAWKLCYPQSAPYAGYIVQTKTANVRCIRVTNSQLCI